jgi:hypothetical protein
VPELPEVETICRGLNQLTLDREILGGDVLLNSSIARSISATDFLTKLKGKSIDRWYRRGKYLLAELSQLTDQKEGWDNIDLFGWLGYPMQIKVNFLCRDSILAAPIVLDLALFMDLAQRAGFQGTQEWLSFYFKSPMAAPGLQPEHDLFIQLMKLKNTLRWMMGEEVISHLGNEYYD